MLYDPKWEVEVKADPLTLESLIAWLETKPTDEAYDYHNCHGRCLYGQYMASHGIKWKESGASIPGLAPKARDRFCELVYCAVADQGPWTFGAALERARAAVSNRSPKP